MTPMQEQRGQPLTEREREVLPLVARGWPNKQIARHLFISPKTVEKHRQAVMNKLGIHDVAGLTMRALADGLIENRFAVKPEMPH